MIRSRRLWLALAASLALHLLVASGPGWFPPSLDEPVEDSAHGFLDARLIPSTGGFEAAPAVPAPRQPRKRRTGTAPPVSPTEARPQPPPEAGSSSAPVQEGMAPVPEPAPTAPQAPSPPIEERKPAPDMAFGDLAFPRRVRIRYQVTMGDNGFIVGKVVHELRHDGRNYVLTNTAITTGLAGIFRPTKVVNVSEGEIAVDGFRPREFRVDRGEGNKEWVRFDREESRILMSNERRFELPPGAQDMLSVFSQLALMPTRGVSWVSLPVVTGKRVERYDFEVMGEEKIMTPRGERLAMHLRNGRADSKESTEVWLSPADANLPVKIRHVDRRGDLYEQLADAIEFGGTTEKD